MIKRLVVMMLLLAAVPAYAHESIDPVDTLRSQESNTTSTVNRAEDSQSAAQDAQDAGQDPYDDVQAVQNPSRAPPSAASDDSTTNADGSVTVPITGAAPATTPPQ